MAVGFSSTVSNAWLNALGNAANYTAPAECWIKLHIGDPGSAGTANPATETTRKQVSFGTASGGAMANDAALTWTTLATGDPDDYTHFSLWDAVAAGNFLGSGLMTANAVQDGDTFVIPIGDLDATLNTAS